MFCLSGVSPLAVVQTLDISSGLQVSRNAFWLLGLNDDFYTIQQIKQTACNEDEIPVIVFFMHPAQGLALDAEAGHYMPDERIGKKMIKLVVASKKLATEIACSQYASTITKKHILRSEQKLKEILTCTFAVLNHFKLLPYFAL